LIFAFLWHLNKFNPMASPSIAAIRSTTFKYGWAKMAERQVYGFGRDWPGLLLGSTRFSMKLNAPKQFYDHATRGTATPSANIHWLLGWPSFGGNTFGAVCHFTHRLRGLEKTGSAA
jgi:hypothetical protein